MAHSIKIDDKLYEKLRAYCDINGISVTKLCNDAIVDYLNTIKFGDAPFLIAEKLINEKQAAEELSETIKNSGITVLDSVKHNDNGDTEVHMSKLDGDNSIGATFKAHLDGTVEMTKDEYHDKDGKLTVTVLSAEDGEKQLIDLLSTHTYDEHEKKEEPKPKRPPKRRL